jgi:hypothetical protein
MWMPKCSFGQQGSQSARRRILRNASSSFLADIYASAQFFDHTPLVTVVRATGRCRKMASSVRDAETPYGNTSG